MTARAPVLLLAGLLLSGPALGSLGPGAPAASALPALGPADAMALLMGELPPAQAQALAEALGRAPRIGALAGVAGAELGEGGSAEPQGAEPGAEEVEEGPPPATWLNDSTFVLDDLFVPDGETVRARNATLLVRSIHVMSNGTLDVERSRILPVEPHGYHVWSEGSARLVDTELVGVTGRLIGSPGNPVILEDVRVHDGGELGLAGAEARVVRGLFYNATGAGLVLAENASAEGSTFVNNVQGVMLQGNGARFVGNDLSFNLVGAVWTGGRDVVFQGNNVHDNFVDGLQAFLGDGATLDVSGNYWSGTPNVDGDSWSGSGISATTHATTAFPVPDLLAALPFTPLKVQGDTTWTGPVLLPGPTIVRGGTLVLDGATVEAAGYIFGSHLASRIHATDSSIRDADIVLARSDDAFVRTVFGRGTATPTVGGILAMGGAPTIRGSTFRELPVAVLVAPRTLGDAPPVVSIEENRVDRCGIGVLALLVQPTLRQNTFENSSIGVVSALSTSVVMDRNLVHGGLIGIASALDQGLAATGNSAYGAGVGFAIIATASPTVTGYEARGNGIGFAALGAQVTLTTSNVYDNPVFGIVAYDIVVPDPATGREVHAPGHVRIDPTTYAGDVDRGNVERVPPARTGPSATPGRAPLTPPDIVASGETRVLTGPHTLTRPLVVRAGGALELRGTTIAGGGQLVGAAPGSRLVVEGGEMDGLLGLAVHTGNARVVDATIRNGTFYDAVFVESDGATVRGVRFLGGMGVLAWDARVLLERCLFANTLTIVASTQPARSTHVRESFFLERGVDIFGDAPARIERSTFYGWGGVEDRHEGLLGSPPGTGATPVDARHDWWGSEEGPRVPGDWWGRGNPVSWPPGGAAVAYAPWLVRPFRASFEASTLVTTNAQPVSFRDSSFDLDGGIVERRWEFGDSSPPSFARDPVHTFADHGEKRVVLEVLDERGFLSLAEALVLVKAIPVASLAGPSEALTLDELVFDANASSDADGRVASYRFAFSDGTSLAPQADPVARHAFRTPGAHAVTLTVRDDEGHASAPIVLPVAVANRAPHASFIVAPSPTTRADATLLSSTSHDVDGAIVETTWDLGDGSPPASGAVVAHRYAALGTYTATVTVRDDHGATATASAQVVVENARPTASFTISPAFVRPGALATFQAAAADRDGAIVSYGWNLGDGAIAEGAEASHAFAEEGDYAVRLTVVDDDGASMVVERLLQVRWNFAPLPSFDVVKGADDSAFAFRDTSVDPDGAIVARAWDLGGSATASSRNVSHRFREPGEHVVTLTVTDDKGASAVATRTVQVDDVLMLEGGVERRGPGEDPVFRLRTLWLNGTGVPADYTIAVRYVPVPGQRIPWASAAGTTGADGNALVPLRGPVPGFAPPGTYELELRVQTRLGHGGNLETAGGVHLYKVAYP